MPKKPNNPEAEPLKVLPIGTASLDIFAGKDVASVPAEDGHDLTAYSHLQVTVTPADAIPEGFRIYFNDDTARCMAREVLTDLIDAMEGR